MIQGFRFKAADIGNYKHVENLGKQLHKECRVMGFTMGDFSLIDLIHTILKKTGRADVYCCTWSAGIKDVHDIKWMLDTDLISRFTIVTDHSYKTRQAKYAASIEDIFGVENIRTSRIHAKFTIIENEDWRIVIRTSMNLNANKTCENFEIDEGGEVFQFYRDFLEHIIGKQKPGFVSSHAIVAKTINSWFNTQNKTTTGWMDVE